MKRLILIIALLFPLAASAASISREQSTVTLTPNAVAADNGTNIGITVTVRDTNGQPVNGQTVTVRSSRGSAVDIIFPQSATTNNFGVATFSIHSGVAGSPQLTTIAGGVTLNTPSPLFGSSGSPAVTNTQVSGATSAVTAETATGIADGISPARIYVTVRNAEGVALRDKRVSLSGSRGNVDAIVERTNPTSEVSPGRVAAVFEIRSTTAGYATYTATSDSVRIEQRATVNFSKTSPAPVPALPPVSPVAGLRAGDLVKSYDSPAVYYIGNDNRRHVFPNGAIYSSWFPNFIGLKIVSPQTLATAPQGANVRVRPGTKLVQFVTLRADGRGLQVSDSRVYVLERGGLLRWMRTPQVAVALYGMQWEREIIPLLETDFSQYRPGVDVIIPDSYNRALVLGSVPTINEDLGL